MAKRIRKNNRIRAGWADQAITAFAEQTGQDTSGDLEHDKPSVLGDLLADVMHWCDVQGVNFHECVDTGEMHYRFEQSDEGDGAAPLNGEPLYKED